MEQKQWKPVGEGVDDTVTMGEIFLLVSTCFRCLEEDLAIRTRCELI